MQWECQLFLWIIPFPLWNNFQSKKRLMGIILFGSANFWCDPLWTFVIVLLQPILSTFDSAYTRHILFMWHSHYIEIESSIFIAISCCKFIIFNSNVQSNSWSRITYNLFHRKFRLLWEYLLVSLLNFPIIFERFKIMNKSINLPPCLQILYKFLFLNSLIYLLS